MKRFKSEKAFTLVEMSVVLSVVALVGTLLVGGVVTTNNNRASADVLEFFDKEIETANENFKIEPQAVLNNEPVRPEPYQNMQYSNLTGSVPGFQYSGFYTENLDPQNVVTTGAAKYMLQITFEQETDITRQKEVEGFDRQLTSYEMKAAVVELVDGKYDFEKPLLERSYKGISVEGELEGNKEKDTKVSYKVVNPDERPATIYNYSTGDSQENELDAMFANGDEFYSQKVAVVEAGSDPDGEDQPAKAFVGWGTESNSRDVIPNDAKVTGEMNVYAVFAEYRVEFQLKPGQQFDPSVVPENPTENYFVEGAFSDHPEGTTTIGEIAEDEGAKTTIETLLGEAESQVIQAGYKFLGWRDAVTKDPISTSLGGKGIDTVLQEGDPYLQLEAVMEKRDPDASLKLNLKLNLSDHKIGDRKFFLYGTSNMDYKVVFDDEKGLGVQQTEYNTWNGKTEQVSEETFYLGGDKLKLEFTDASDGKVDSAASLEELLKNYAGKYVEVSSVKVTVTAPTFNSESYRNEPEATRDKVYYNGVRVTNEQLKSLDVSGTFPSDKMKYQTKDLDGAETNLPMDEETNNALNEKLLSSYGQDKTQAQVKVYNVSGGISHNKGNGSSVTTRTEKIEVKIPGTPEKKVYGDRTGITYKIVVPLTLLNGNPQNGGTMNKPNVQISVGVNNEGNIYISVGGTIGVGGYPLYYGGGGDTFDTGIKYKDTYNGQTIYNRITTVQVATDETADRYTLSSSLNIIPGNGVTSTTWGTSGTKGMTVQDITQGAGLWMNRMDDWCRGQSGKSYCQASGGYPHQLQKGLYSANPVGPSGNVVQVFGKDSEPVVVETIPGTPERTEWKDQNWKTFNFDGFCTLPNGFTCANK